MVTVPTLQGFEDYVYTVLGDDSGELVIWCNSINEYVVIVLLHVPEAARDGTIGVACTDPWMYGNGRDVFVLSHLAFAVKSILPASWKLTVVVVSTLLTR